MNERSGFTLMERVIATGVVTASFVMMLYPLGWFVIHYPLAFATGLWVTLMTVLCAIDR